MQKRSSSRNYIDLVMNEDDERRAIEPRPAYMRPIRDYLLGLVAAMRSPRSEAR